MGERGESSGSSSWSLWGKLCFFFLRKIGYFQPFPEDVLWSFSCCLYAGFGKCFLEGPGDPHTDFLAKGSSSVPPNFPCRIKNKTVFIKLLLLSVPQSVYSGGRADRTRSSAFSSPSFPRIQSFSGLWQTILQSVTPLFSSHLGVLYCHMPSSMLSETYFLSEKRVLS